MVIKNKDFQSAASEFLAFAILDLFPKAKIFETYQTDFGFGVDFIIDQNFDDVSFNLIDERMRILFKKGLIIESVDMMRENAAALLKHHHQNLLADKVLLDSRNILSLTRIGKCYGYSTISDELNSKSIGLAKLIDFSLRKEEVKDCGECTIISLEGALCKDSQSLKKFFKNYERLRKSDHQYLGPQLELFFHPENALSGCWTWLPKGETIKEILTSWLRKNREANGYFPISTSKWFKKSKNKNMNSQPVTLSHGQHIEEFEYRSDATSVIYDIFRLKQRDCDDLPLRLAEFSEVFSPNTERKNIGLFRGEIFTKDSSYCLCAETQAAEELISSLQFLMKSIKMFAIDYQWYLVSNKPKSVESQRSWDYGTNILVQALKQCEIDYIEDSVKKPSRGPRIEARFTDPLGREWEGPSIEISLDKKNRDLFYKGSDNKEHRPVLIQWTLFGSLERFVALLVERYAGLLPIWLAPEQVRVIPITEKYLNYAREIYEQLLHKGVRATLDCTKESLATKVFAVKTAKIPYAIVLGDNEQRNGTIAVCPCEDKGKGQQQKISAFIESILNEIQATKPSHFETGN